MDASNTVLWRVNNEYRKRLSQAQTYLDLLEQLIIANCGEEPMHTLESLRYAREQVAQIVEEHRHWRHTFYYESQASRRMVQNDRAVNRALARFSRMRTQHEQRLFDLYNILYQTPRPDPLATRVPNGDFIPTERAGLTICDATSAAFAMDLPWDKLDVTTFSFQKALGGEAGIGLMVLSPRAVARLDTYRPDRAVPKVLRIVDKKGFDRTLADGVVMNTFSVLTIEDWIDALDWAKDAGGLPALIARTDANYAALAEWVERTDWIDFLPERPEIRSTTSVCLKFVDPRIAAMDEAGQKAFVKRFKGLLEGEGAVYDMEPHRYAPPGLRLWCGCTVETADVVAATPWLEWAFQTAVDELAG